MKNFFSNLWKFFKKPWVLWTLLFIVLILLIWVLSWYVSFIRTYRVYVVLFLVVLWGINNIRLQQKKNLEEKIESDPEYTPEEQSLMEQEIRNGFLASIRTLPRHAWYSWRSIFKSPEGQIPWFVTVGAPASGKTTALLNSDLDFPVEFNDPKLPDNYGTWRYSVAAAFLDIRGGLLTHNRETDNLTRAAWKEVLNQIQKYRYQKSFNGIILSVNLEDLLHQSEEALALQAYHLSKALQDLEAAMGFQCPVYLQITKTDLLNGFKEFSDLLNLEDQQYGLGFSLPNDTFPLRHFSKRFNGLIDSLLSKLLLSLHHEKNAQKAAAAALFPSELQELKKRLERYLSLLFESNQYRERSFLRGLFFISAVFSAKVQQNLLQPYINEFGLKLRAPTYLINNNPNHLVNSVYKNFILEEQNVYRFSYLTRQAFIIRNGLIGLFTLALLSISVYFLFGSYEQNNVKLQQLHKDAQRYLSNLQHGAADNLEQRNIQLRLLDEMDNIFKPEQDPFSMHWGLYQGSTVSKALEKFYIPVLQEQFLPIMLDRIKQVIRDPSTSVGDVYDFLRAYIMLGDHSHLDADFVENLMNEEWESVYANQPALRQLLTISTSSYFQRTMPQIKLEPDLIHLARNRLKDISPSEQIYSQLSSLNYGKPYSIAGESLRDFNHIFDEQEAITQIPALFTMKAYSDAYKKEIDRLIRTINDNDWVLGEKVQRTITPEQAEIIKQRVQGMYLNQYVSVWRRSVYSLKLKSFKTLSEAHDFLNVLAQKNSPLETILKSLNENTILLPGDKIPPPNAAKSMFDIKKVSAGASKGTSGIKSMASAANIAKNADQIVGTVKNLTTSKERTPVGEAFYDLNRLTLVNEADGEVPFNQIYDAIVVLNNYVHDVAGAADPIKAAYTVATEHAGSAGSDDPIGTLIKLANQSPEPVKRWLLEIAKNTWTVILQNSVTYLNEEWAISVYPQYEEIFSSYPFNKNSMTDLDPQHLVDFLKKDGILDKFITTYLAPFINTNAAPWQLNNIDGSVLPIGSVSKLYAMIQLQMAFFGGKGGDGKGITIPFTLTTVQLDNSLFMAQLKMGDKLYSSLHGPHIPESMNWIPDPNGSVSVQFTATNRAVTNTGKHGNWAWMKLLDTAELNNRDNLSFSAKFTLHDKSVTYLIKTSGPVNPFNLPRLRAITLPKNL
jgi:type VI secretion system protein ImpL